MKKSLLTFLFFIIGSCTVVPEVAPLIDPAEIAKFAKTIEDAGLVFVKDGALAPFRIAPNGTYDDSQNITYQISQIIDDSTVSALSVDFGEQTHELLGGTFGVTFQAIAFQRATPEEILDFKNTIDPKELISEQGGTWAPFTIAPDGTYTTSGVTYEIARIVDENTLLVVKSTGGLETHKLVDTDFGRIDASGAVFEEVAFKRATDAEIEPLRTGVNNFIYQNHGAWEPFIIATDRTYTVNGVAYEIGKIIDGDSANPIALVAKDTGGDTGSIERHKLIASKFGPINEDDDDITILSFKGSTASEILAYLTTLSEYIFAKNNIWNPLPKTDNSYTDVNGKTYSIGRVDPATRSILVANSDGGIETHGIRESSFGELTLSAVSKEIAFQRASTSELSTFIASLNNFIFAKSGVWNLLTTTVNSYTDANNITYDIGKINGTTIEVISLANGIETHKLESEKLIKTSDATEIAFKGSTDSEINTFLDNLDTFIFAKDGIWKSILLTDATASRGGTYDDVNNITYDIGQINGNNIKVVSLANGIETHKLENNILSKTSDATEIAFKGSTDSEINTFLDNLDTFIFAKDGIWKSILLTDATASRGGTYDDVNNITYDIGQINGNNIKVVSADFGIETHKLENKKLIKTVGRTEIAFKKADATEINTFATTKINDFIFESAGAWANFDVDPILGTYSDATGETYTIGRFTDSTTVEVISLVNGIEFHGIVNKNFKELGNRLNFAFQRATPEEIDKLKDTTLKDFIFHTSIGWVDLTIAKTTTAPVVATYPIGGFAYEIGRFLDDSTVEVAKSGGSIKAIETHKIIANTSFGPVTTSGGSTITELAFKKVTDTEVIDFAKSIKPKKLKHAGAVTPFEINATLGTYTDKDRKTYEIGRMINPTTALVSKAGTVHTLETNGIRGDKYGRITDIDAPTIDHSDDIIAEVSPLDDLISRLAMYSYAKDGDWVDIKVEVDEAANTAKFIAHGNTSAHPTFTINISSIDLTVVPATVKVTSSEGEQTIKLETTEITGTGRILAIKKSDSGLISDYSSDITDKNLLKSSDKMINFELLASGTWKGADTKMFKIGRVDIIGTKTNVIVSAQGTGITHPNCIQTFGYSETTADGKFFAPIKAGSVDKTSKDGAEFTKLDIHVRALREKLVDYVYPEDGKWADDFPAQLEKPNKLGDYKYTVGDATYNITDIDTADWNVEVVKTVDGVADIIETHVLKGEIFGVATTTGDKVDPTKVIALRKNATDTFIAHINSKKLTRKDDGSLFVIKNDGSYSHDSYTMWIGRVIDPDTVLVVLNNIKTGKTDTEIQGLREDKFGLLNLDYDTVIPESMIAHKDTRLADLKIKLKDYVYITAGTVADFPAVIIPITTDPRYLGKYKVGSTTYYIKDINSAIDIVTLTDGKIHRLLEASGQYGVVASGGKITRGTEIAFKRDPKAVKDFIDKINTTGLKYVKKNDNNWYPFGINTDGTYADNRKDKYTIVSVIDPNTVLVTFDNKGEMDIHQLDGNDLKVYNPAMEFNRITAVKTSTDEAIKKYAKKINDLELKYTESHDRFEIDTTYFTYTHDGKEYRIGAVDGNIATVAQNTEHIPFIFKHELHEYSGTYFILNLPDETYGDKIAED